MKEKEVRIGRLVRFSKMPINHIISEHYIDPSHTFDEIFRIVGFGDAYTYVQLETVNGEPFTHGNNPTGHVYIKRLEPLSEMDESAKE